MSGPHRQRRLLLHSFFNLLGVVLPALIAIVSIPPLLDALGPADFGLLSIQLGVLVLVGVNDFGVSRAVVLVAIDRGGFHNVADRIAVVGAGLSLILPVSFMLLIAGIALLIGADIFADGARAGNLVSWSLLLASSAFALPTLPLRASMEVAERFGALNLLRSMAASLLFLAPLIAVQFAPTLIAATAGLLVSRIIVLVAFAGDAGTPVRQSVKEAFADLRRDARERRLAPLQAELVRRGGWLGAAGTASTLLTYVERFALGFVLGAAAVANFVIAAELATKLWLIVGAFLAAATPRIANGWSGRVGGAFRGDFMLLAVSVLLVAMAFHCAILFGGDTILRTWLTDQYDPGMNDLLRVLSIGVTINCLSQVNYQLLVISGRERVAAYLSMFWLVPSVVVSLAAAHTFGPPGVAWTFALRQLADVFVVKFLVARSGEPGLQGGLPYSLAVAWTAVVIGLYAVS